MRFSPAAIALSTLLLTTASVSVGKRPDVQIDPQSLAMASEAEAARKAGDKEAAVGWYETALAVDPRNRAAYLGLADLAKEAGLKGKAIRYYKNALDIEPNDPTVLVQQGELMIEKGALESAKKNVARLRMLCRTDCSAAEKLSSLIDKSGEKKPVEQAAGELKPVASQLPDEKK